MKLKGIFGKGSGKVGAAVWAVSGGEQIVREYNPTVSNPNTEAQVAQRAKMKLMSQLASVLAPALGFTKQKLVSARNQFVSKNMGICRFENNQADVNLTELQLTPSSLVFPGLKLDDAGEGTLEVSLESAAPADVKRVAYFVYRQTAESKLEYVASKIVTEAGENRLFVTDFNGVLGDYVVYAYGIKDANANATFKYEDYMSNATSPLANLEVINLFRTADYKLTASVGALISVS